MLSWRWVWVVVLAGSVPRVLYAADWRVPRADREIRVDGHLDEWQGIPALTLSPEVEGLESGGAFSGEGDVYLTLQAAWDPERLYVAIVWRDDEWDIEEVKRRDAVWVDPQGKRRDRLLFFDNLKLHFHEADYDYVFWLSPRKDDQGPYFWCRLLEGYRRLERASLDPLVSTSLRDDGSQQMEVMFFWKQLRQDPKRKKPLPVTVILADSDQPRVSLESKLPHLKWLAWVGYIQFIE